MPDLSGNLSAFGIRRTLEFLGDSGASGELRVAADGSASRILFHRGAVAYATTATGADTVQELDTLLARYQPGAEGNPDGAPDTLEQALEEQVTDVLYNTVGWEEGSFEFSCSELQAAAVHATSVEDALQRVAERVAEWEQIRVVIPSNDAVFTLSPRLPAGTSRATFDGLAWRLVALIGDGGSVDFLAGELGVSIYRAARLLADMVEAGYVRPDGGDHLDPPAEVAHVVEPELPSAYAELAAEDTEEIEMLDFDEPDPMPDIRPEADAVEFTSRDLSQEEKDALIRNMGNGVFPT